MYKNTPSSQVHMEHSPGYTISWVTNQASVNLRKLKLYQASSPTMSLWGYVNYKEKTVRNTNTWGLNNTFLNNQQVTREIKNFLETNDNENATTQNLWDAAKAVLRGKFIVIQSYLKKQEKHWIDSLTLHLKQLEKEEQKDPKISKRKEITKIQAQINEKEMKETILKTNKTKSCFFEKIKLTNL